MFKKKEEHEEPKEDIKKPESMHEKLDKILMYFESGLKDKKKKEFKLPFRARSVARTYHKRNKILVLMISRNWALKPIVGTLVHGMLKIKDNWHTIPFDRIIFWKGKIPTIILPEWQITPIDIRPLDIQDIEKQSEKEKNIVDAQTYILRAIKMESAMLARKMFSGKGIIWIGIVGIVAAYLIFGGGIG